MAVRVISGPAPIVTPAEVPGGHASNDATITALIAAVQASIDGPTGWLGRALGVQTLAMTRAGFSRIIRLPYEPVTSITSIVYRDTEGTAHTVDIADYRLAGSNAIVFGTDYNFPTAECAPDAVTITYEAGYPAEDMPASAKQAVIIGVQQMKPLAERDLSLREEDVEGVGSTTYTVSEASAALVKSATESLLAPLKVWWL